MTTTTNRAADVRAVVLVVVEHDVVMVYKVIKVTTTTATVDRS